MTKKVVKRKLNVKALLVMLLTIYLIGMIIYYLFTMPIKRIIINGNNLLTDNDIITTASLTDYPPIFRTSSNEIKKKIEQLDIVKEATVSKSIKGTLTITIEEEIVLFYNKPTEKYYLSNMQQVEITSLTGVPTLINYTPSNILENLIKKMKLTNKDILSSVSEIKYSPDIKNEVMIDEYRFILSMNDGNTVHINIANFDKLEQYKKLFAVIGEEKKGTFYLDGIGTNILFKEYGAEGEDKVELPE